MRNKTKKTINETVDMTGKVCMVTGANSGLGYEIALALAGMGATVVLVCRNAAKGEAARERLIAATGNMDIDLLVADLSSQQSIREMVDTFTSEQQKLNVLLNNAGFIGLQRRETVDGLEMNFMVNYLAPFMLTHLLLGILQKAAETDGEARVVNISSSAQAQGKINLDDLQSEKRYHIMKVYAGSKLALVLASKKFAAVLQGTGITVNCVGPGYIRTSFNAKAGGIISAINTFPPSKWFIQNVLGKSAADAALTPLYLATSPEVKGRSGLFYGDYCELQTPSRWVDDEKLGRELWDVSAELSNT